MQSRLESLVEAGQRLCCAGVGRELVPTMRVRIEKSCDLVEHLLSALSVGSASHLKDVVEGALQLGH